ncbi:MAG: DUF4908 domain-containing protein [Hyphomonadaceae bacterium]
MALCATMDFALSLRLTGAVAAALALSGAAAGQAFAQSASPLMQGLLADFHNGEAAKQYATPDGALRFVLDRSGGRIALLRLEGDPEVHVLRPVAGAGGDELYRTENGRIVLRLTPHGGITIYTRNNQAGAAAAEEREVAPLAPQAAPPSIYQARLRDVQADATRRLGRPVAFEAPPTAGAAASGLMLDAAERAAEAIVRAQGDLIRRVVFVVGPEPIAMVRGDTLIVQVVPAMGYAGRPSSMVITGVVQRANQGPER